MVEARDQVMVGARDHVMVEAMDYIPSTSLYKVFLSPVRQVI